MYSDGYQNVISLDYSTSCIESMKLQFPETDSFKWLLGDMTNLVDFKAAQFDLVIDKAAMDAIMVEEGDVWNPDTNVIDMARKMCREISRVLRVGGMHLQVSFAQPHFRRKYLEGRHGGEGGGEFGGRGRGEVRRERERELFYEVHSGLVSTPRSPSTHVHNQINLIQNPKPTHPTPTTLATNTSRLLRRLQRIRLGPNRRASRRR